MFVNDSDHMASLFLSLLGKTGEGGEKKGEGEGIKPFECVGTSREAAAAVHLAVRRHILRDTAGNALQSECKEKARAAMLSLPPILSLLARRIGIVEAVLEDTMESNRALSLLAMDEEAIVTFWLSS
jgi:hypothetical protein